MADTVEISSKGNWVRVPALVVEGATLIVKGRLLKIASVHDEAWLETEIKDPEMCVQQLKSGGPDRLRADIFTFSQRVPATSPRYRYRVEWDNLAVLPVSTFDNWWTKQIDAKTRNMVRKAEKKGMEVREVAFDDALVQGIAGLYNECPVRQGKPFWHYGKDFQTVRRENESFLNRSILIGAFLNGSLIGFAKLVGDGQRTQAGLMQIISMIQHRDKAPTNALIAQAVRSCADRGIRYLLYANFGYGKKQRDTLSDFKGRNGFQRIELPRYYVPLTLRGWIALRLGLHHRLVERIPESVLTKVRELRSAWYNRKFQSLTEAS
jgi:hypothetical protein